VRRVLLSGASRVVGAEILGPLLDPRQRVASVAPTRNALALKSPRLTKSVYDTSAAERRGDMHPAFCTADRLKLSKD